MYAAWTMMHSPVDTLTQPCFLFSPGSAFEQERDQRDDIARSRDLSPSHVKR